MNTTQVWPLILHISGHYVPRIVTTITILLYYTIILYTYHYLYTPENKNNKQGTTIQKINSDIR